MITLLSPHYKAYPVTHGDLTIASIAWGFTLGFGWLTTWTALKQTTHIYRRHGLQIWRNSYVVMLWAEITVCLIFSVICWMHLHGMIAPSFAFYFSILTTWTLQVQFLLQIIINRCAILLADKRKARRIKFSVAALVTCINISVYCIWIPARLQISDRFIWINEWWDRCEKVIYLIADASLNIYFVIVVQRNLVSNGLEKYRRLTKFNIFIIGFSLSMDVLIIGMMSLPNTFVYMQFHPLAYIVKLKIEMSMADLIGKIARKRKRLETYQDSRSNGTTYRGGNVARSRQHGTAGPASNMPMMKEWQSGLEVTNISTCTHEPPSGVAESARAPVSPDPPDGPEGTTTPQRIEIYTLREVIIQSEAMMQGRGADWHLEPDDIMLEMVSACDESVQFEMDHIWDGTSRPPGLDAVNPDGIMNPFDVGTEE